jgi:hypothetical protein
VSRALIILNDISSRSRAMNWITELPVGTRVEFKGAKRTLPQNDRMWAMLTDIATQKEHFGRRYKPDQWKAIFMHAIGREIQFIPTMAGDEIISWGLNSSDLSKEEMSDLIAFMQAWGDQSGVVFHDKTEVVE